ncbi:hypothetical protein ACFQPF_01000 [Fictibacillus iocasae]|uniref:Uncharacterized protein n=1 Tax=Fictibacillus iocasae TaxID=2715437 RepID=A0ABW2NQC5_9BACL
MNQHHPKERRRKTAEGLLNEEMDEAKKVGRMMKSSLMRRSINDRVQ